MVKKLLLTVFLLLVQAVVFAATYTFNGTTNSDWNNGANWSGGIIAPTAPGNGDIIIINANVNVGSITIGNGATLKVNAPATLTVGPVGTSATTQVVDFQNGCIVVIESGASLVVNGLLNNSNNSKGVTFNGSVSVTGNVTAGNGSTIVGTGTLDTTGSIITDSPTGSIFGSTGDCLNGPCSGSQLNCSGESNMISSNQTICRGNTPATLIGSTTINPATYQWQESTTSGANFSDILGATSSNYPPGSLTTTTYYRRKQTVGGCTGTSSQVTVTVNALPTTPAAGTVSQPTCATATGTFQITGFDSARTYTFTPAVVSTSDTGLVTANAGTYTFTVNNAAGCTSLASANIVVNAQPATPSAPTVGTMTQPTCTVSTGSVVLNSLPSGSWTINPGNITGSTTSRTITGLAAGTTFNYTVTNSVGCTSGASANVVINAQPATPSAPTVGTINQPTCTVATGSVVLNGLPSGSWTINPGNIAGSTTSTTIAGLAAETTFNYTVTNAAGCTSVASANVVINAQPTTPSAPTVGTITQPTCTVATGSVVLNG